MAKFILLVALALLLIAASNALSFGDCPSPQSSQMASCTPKCLQNSECSTMGGLCCPNLCNTRSCTRPKSGSQGSSSGAFKGSSQSTATGSYCGNEKCNSYQKCEFDKATKRQKCVRT